MYNPAVKINNNRNSSISFAIRLIELPFGREFNDIISWGDNHSLLNPAGAFTLTMRFTRTNEALLTRLRPGIILEAYAPRDDEPTALIGEAKNTWDIDNDFDVFYDEAPEPRPEKATPVQQAPIARELSLGIRPEFKDGGKGYEYKGDDYSYFD